MNCRFIDTGFNDAFTNMAIDEALLDSKEIVLRLYQWKPAAVSIGYNQNIQKEINVDFCIENNIDIVRRITGGKAVFHNQELTYSFILPENLDLVPKDINESYKVIAQALVLGLKEVGITATVKQQPDRIATPICFNSSNWYELLSSDKKISGSAQRRIDGMILQHGSILIDFDYDLNSKIFKTNDPEKTLKELEKNITSIKKENKDSDIGGLKESITNGFSKNFNLKMVDKSLTSEEIERVNKLKKEKYRTDSWNFRD